MKVTKKVEEPGFRPVTVSITFESAAELQVFKAVLHRDVSVPDLVYPSDSLLNQQLRIVLNKLNHEL